MNAVRRHWSVIAGALLLLAALAPMKLISNVWRVWEDWGVADWAWAINLVNLLLIVTALLCLFAAALAFGRNREPALRVALWAVVAAVLYIVGYVVLTQLLLQNSWFDAVKVSVRYWFIGEGYDSSGHSTVYVSSIIGGPVAWLSLGLAIWVLSTARHASERKHSV